MHIFHINFYSLSFNRTQNLHFPKNSGKIVITASLSKLSLKNYISVIFQSKYIACKILYDSIQLNSRQNYHKSFRKRGIAAPPTVLYVPKLLCINILNVKLHKILCISSRATFATNFLSHRQADIFLKQSNHVQDIPKCVNPSETGSRKLFRN